MEYFIRAFEKQDIPFLWEMLYQSIYVGKGQQQPRREIVKDPHIEKYLKDWGGKDDHALIAIGKGDNPIGAIWIRRFNNNCAGYGFVDEETPELGMALLSRYRGKGIGNELLKEMSKMARLLDYKALSLSVDPRNEPALKLYEKNGYVRVGEEDGGSWTMKKILIVDKHS
jgi:RimJ/RimL family protein N-acetyltransferase